MHYFVRANGDTAHNDPSRRSCFVPGEPPLYPQTYFNYVRFCLEHGIARLGHPDTGDLTGRPKQGALAECYDLETVRPYVRRNLETFRNIEVGDVILMPEPGEGILFAGDVVKPYHYFHRVPTDPYECAHRLGVRWDVTADSNPVNYTAVELGISRPRGFWRRGFQVIENTRAGAEIVQRLQRLRETRSKGS